MSLVSIVVPAYNAQSYVQRAVGTALGQSHNELEVIVVDDGSTDRTGEIVEDMAKLDARLRVVKKSNGGVCSARNVGLKLATGAYSLFLDADDLLMPWTVDRLLNSARTGANGAVLSFGRAVPVTEDEFVLRPPGLRWTHDDSMDSWIRGNNVKCGSGGLVVTEVARVVGGFDESLRSEEGEICADWLFYLRLRAEGPTQYRPLPTVGYRTRDDSMSADPVETLRAIEGMYGRLRKDYGETYSFRHDTVMAEHVATRLSVELTAGRMSVAGRILRQVPTGQRVRAMVRLVASPDSLLHWRRLVGRFGAGGTIDRNGFPMAFDEYVATVARNPVWGLDEEKSA